MNPNHFTVVFLAALALSTGLRLWLDLRHLRHVCAHRDAVPADFFGRIELVDHRKAADYTAAKVRLGFYEIALDALLLLVFTLGGALALIDGGLRDWLGAGHLQGLALFAAVAVIGFVVGLPASLYRSFVIEERYGFNKLTWQLWLADLAKGAALTLLIGGPLLYAVLWLMDAMGRNWWLYVWLVWLATNLLILFLYPTVIAPLFNKFTPLEDASLKARIEALLARCGFASSGLFVMDGSKRSAHGNAYFTGFGRAKRIVFFDTLLAKLAPEEIEAVLAHELGHFRHKHVIKRIALSAVMSLAFLWLLGQLIDQPWFYQGLGVGSGGTAMGLLLFSMVLPIFLFPLAPLTSALSRRHEYEADAYAAKQTAAVDLIAALVKLYRDNAATLTPDPLHSLFHDSHPPASQRIARLETTLNGAPMNQVCDLSKGKCKPCEGGVPPLSDAEATAMLATLPGWQRDGSVISKTYKFKNYYETMAFVNATAWISHREDHHPDLAVGWGQCTVSYTTHAIGGLSENDFICAAKIDALLTL